MKALALRSGDLWILANIARDIDIDVSHVIRGYRGWHSRDPELRSEAEPLSSTGSSLTQGLFRFFTAVSLTTAAGQVGGTGGALIAGGLSALTWGGSILSSQEPEPAILEECNGNLSGHDIIEAAKKGPLNFRQIAAFFGESLDNYPYPNDGSTDVLSVIRQSSSRKMSESRSLSNTYKLATNFRRLAAIALQGLRQDPKTQDNLLHAMGIGVLSQLGWRPTILNPEMFAQVSELKKQGKKVIFVANHRSYLDVLCLLTVLRDFSPRFVAKKELELFLGALLNEGGHLLIDRDKEIVKSLLELVRWGLTSLVEDCSPVIFFEGSRAVTDPIHGEIGLQPAESGASFLASKAGKVFVVPIMMAGTGHALPKGSLATQSRPQIMISMGEPIEFYHFSRRSEGLNHKIWVDSWHQLAPMQAVLNNLLFTR